MSASMTSGQRKQIVRLFEDDAEWALDIIEKELTQEQAQRLLGRGGDLRAKFPEWIRELACGRYADEERASTWTYPPEYQGLKPIRDQLALLLKHFPHLDATWALEKGESWYKSLSLPEWIEGPLVYIWQGESYHETLLQVFEKIVASREFHNYREGQIDCLHLRQTKLTLDCERKLHEIQPGSFLIVPSQVGWRHRGRSVRRAREVFVENEFGHGALALSCHALTHPSRFVRCEQLQVDGAGDEFSSEADGVFSQAPYFNFRDGEVRFDTNWLGDADGRYGSASGLLPQQTLVF